MNAIADAARPLEGKSALVTGASSGIGRAIALRLARAGARVWASDVTEKVVEGGAPVIEPLQQLSPLSTFAKLDVRDPEATAALMETIGRVAGRLDIVVPSAMVPGGKALNETDMDEWRRVTEVNLTGVYVTLHGALMQMLKQDLIAGERGRFVVIGSQHGMIASPHSFAYSASKAAVLQMTRQIAVDHAKDGIIANAVSPGKILTGKTGAAISEEMISYSNTRTPLPRLGKPDDVAEAVLFLASPNATFITGHNLMVDGGWMAG